MFGEGFGRVRMVGFGLVWTALALYTIEGHWHARRAPRAA